MLTRRNSLQGTFAIAAAAMIGGKAARAKELKTVSIGVGQKAIAPNLINLLIGETLGYNEMEGFTIKCMALGTNANVQVAVDRGSVDIGVGVPSSGLPMLARGDWGSVLNFYEYTYPYKWDIVVSPGSAVKSYKELKGKNIGVSDFGGTEYPVTRNVLKTLGLDPDKDVKWTAVGNGLQAGVALQRNVIDALAYYDTGFGQIEAAGIPMEFLPRPADLPMVGGQFLMAQKATLTTQRDLMIGVGRSVAKASIFLLANPEAGAKAFLKMYPETAPRGSSQEDAVKSILQAVGRRIKLYAPPYPNAKIGSINQNEFIAEAAMNNLKIANLQSYFTNDLIDQITAFNEAEVRAHALAYRS
jgi:NitT/TauT family transport system substrate-binding protein